MEIAQNKQTSDHEIAIMNKMLRQSRLNYRYYSEKISRERDQKNYSV